jgi:hypothetical protein
MRDCQSMANDLLDIGSWAVSNPRGPWLCAPASRRVSLFDNLGIGSYRLDFERSRPDWR